MEWNEPALVFRTSKLLIGEQTGQEIHVTLAYVLLDIISPGS